MILASPEGGTGSAWLVDVARLIRRNLRLLQGQGRLRVVPEITGLLLSPPDNGGDNARSLALELETAQLVGGSHARQCYQPGHSELEWDELEAPFNQIMVVAAHPGPVTFSQAASVAASLVQRGARAAVLDLAEIRPEDLTTPVRVSGLHVCPHPTARSRPFGSAVPPFGARCVACRQ